jgi:hypothetical protein
MSEAENAVAIRKNNGSMVPLIPDDAEGVFKVSQYLAKSDLVPKSFGGRPENVFAAIMYGREIGVSAMQALSNIAVVNGRPSVWGELATALVRQSGLCEYLNYKFEGTGATLKCIATGKRKGDTESHTETFSMEDAKVAGFDKKDTYLKHPKDMLMWKALHRLYKFLWADVIKGISIREVAEDIPMEEVGTVVIEEPKKAIDKPAAAAPAPEKAEEPKKRGPGRPPKAEPTEEPSKDAPPSPASEALADIPGETELDPPAPAEETTATTLTRVFGTLMGCVKLSGPIAYPGDHAKAGQPHPDAGKFIGYAVKVQTKEGEQKFMVGNYDEAVKMGPLKNKTVELFTEPTPETIVGVAGKVVKYGAVNP